MLTQFISQTLPKNDEEQKTPSVPGVNLTFQDKEQGSSLKQNVVVLGRVESEFGELIAGETIAFHSPSLRVHYTTISNAYGEYVFTDVLPGRDYVITVSPIGMYKRYTESGVILNRGQITQDITLESIPLGMLTGTLLDSYDRPVIDMPLTLRTLEKDFFSTDVVTDANGAFYVQRFPKGRFKVSSQFQQTFEATGLIFDPDIGVPVILTVDLGLYSLGGRIIDESGHPFVRANAIVLWTTQNNEIRNQSTRQVTTDKTGSFRFTGLGPGDHELIMSVWNGNTFKKTVKQVVNLGVDPGELEILIDTL